MAGLYERQFREVVECIVELEDRLRTQRLSLSHEHRMCCNLAVLYGILEELWPIVPGRGERHEPC